MDGSNNEYWGHLKGKCFKNSFSGPLIRGSQIPWDLRKTTPYEIYKDLNFRTIVGNYGDSYDRYKVRIEEMRESCKIIKQVVVICSNIISYERNNNLVSDHEKVTRRKEEVTMESLIAHFKYYSKGFKVAEGISFISTEAPKGEFSIFLVSDGSEKIYRCSIKTPGFVHLRSIDIMSKNKYIADLITNLGTLDIVLGECDR